MSAAFLTRFPEFSDGRAPPELVSSCLAEAERHVASSEWGGARQDAVYYYAAHLLSTNPWGQQARLNTDGEKSAYMVAYEKLRRSTIVGPRVFL